MRICNLREKQVINSADCKILGYVQDVEFDLCSGCIKAIIVPGPPKLFCFFGADCEYASYFSIFLSSSIKVFTSLNSLYTEAKRT